MDVLTFETCWAVNGEIIKRVTSSWSIFIQLSAYLLITYGYTKTVNYVILLFAVVNFWRAASRLDTGCTTGFRSFNRGRELFMVRAPSVLYPMGTYSYFLRDNWATNSDHLLLCNVSVIICGVIPPLSPLFIVDNHRGYFRSTICLHCVIKRQSYSWC